MLIPRVKCRYLERSCARSNGVDRSRTARQKNEPRDRKSTRLNSSHGYISYAVFCLKKNIEEERSFLNSAVKILRSTGVDMIMPGLNATVFRTYPVGAVASPYRTLLKNLNEPEDELM